MVLKFLQVSLAPSTRELKILLELWKKQNDAIKHIKLFQCYKISTSSNFQFSQRRHCVINLQNMTTVMLAISCVQNVIFLQHIYFYSLNYWSYSWITAFTSVMIWIGHEKQE